MSEPLAVARRTSPGWTRIALVISGIYLLVACIILPLWRDQEAVWHPDRLDGVRLTHTGGVMPGDPLNLALVGSGEEGSRSLQAASWRMRWGSAAACGSRSIPSSGNPIPVLP